MSVSWFGSGVECRQLVIRVEDGESVGSAAAGGKARETEVTGTVCVVV